ncbi:hypothetical protein HanIR_Chr13g0638561 [Helianthus annuus]|nr:hypothetical protein HanIR_Chr13g0638561 [Helianthus annuus]
MWISGDLLANEHKDPVPVRGGVIKKIVKDIVKGCGGGNNGGNNNNNNNNQLLVDGLI